MNKTTDTGPMEISIVHIVLASAFVFVTVVVVVCVVVVVVLCRRRRHQTQDILISNPIPLGRCLFEYYTTQ